MTSINEFNTLNEMIDSRLASYTTSPAFTCLGQTCSFEEIDNKSKALANWFKAQGLNKGDRIVIQLPNIIQYPIAFYAALRSGLIVVNTNPMYTSQEMQHQFKDSGAKAIIIINDFVGKLEEIKAQTNIDVVLVTNPTDLLTGALAINDKYTSLNQAIEIGSPLEYQSVNSKPDEICVLQYTGGTTGVSKGASLSHKNIMVNAEQTIERFGDAFIEKSEALVCPLPLYHIYALNVSMVMYASAGNHTVLIPNPADLDAFISAICPHKFTAFAGINTLFIGLCNKPEFKTLDFSHLKVTISGGTTLTTAAANIWQEVANCTISEGYGLSETAPVVSINQPGNEEVGSVGPELFNTKIRLIDLDGNEVSEGEEGELCVSGPQVMSGYWNMPKETAKVFTEDGFFKTGDIAVRTALGNIKIVDRIKDMIIVSGFNVYPNQIEDVITQHPAVLEAAVIGEPDEKTGEKVCAYITVNKDIDPAEVIEFCRLSLTPYKVPKKMQILDALPKSTVGKILRRELRA